MTLSLAKTPDCAPALILDIVYWIQGLAHCLFSKQTNDRLAAGVVLMCRACLAWQRGMFDPFCARLLQCSLLSATGCTEQARSQRQLHVWKQQHTSWQSAYASPCSPMTSCTLWSARYVTALVSQVCYCWGQPGMLPLRSARYVTQLAVRACQFGGCPSPCHCLHGPLSSSTE